MDRAKLIDFAQKWAASNRVPYDYYFETKHTYTLTTKEYLDSGFISCGGCDSIVIDKETGEFIPFPIFHYGASEEDIREISEGFIADLKD